MATRSVMGGAVGEDPALIRGTGINVDDLQPPGLAHKAFQRSPVGLARAKLRSRRRGN